MIFEFFLGNFLIFYSSATIISTSFGQIKGFHENGTIFHSFKNIPFAKPPIGNLRFQKPEPPEKWENVRDGTKYGPACMSNSTVSRTIQKWVEEDCLQINIFTSNNCLRTKNCPVVFYIHGGGLSYDSAVMFNDTHFLDVFVKRDIVFIISAFRLGIFGVFTLEDQNIAPNNVAVYDILQGLEFVNKEINAFGGDPKKVTIFGHSYGGAIVSAMIFSQNINKDLRLFQQGISMSPSSEFITFDLLSAKTLIFAEKAGCGAKNLKKNEKEKYMNSCLLKKNASELLRVTRELEEETGMELGFMVQRLPLFQGSSVSDFFKNPKNVSYLTGTTIHEYDDDNETMIIADNLDYKNQKEIFIYYNQQKASGKINLPHTDKTQRIMVGAKHRADQLTTSGASVYFYEYSNEKHAFHTDDLSYLMGIHRFEQDENEQKLAQIYAQIFTNFIKFGKPKNEWKTFDSINNSYFDINFDVKNQQIQPKMKKFYEKKVIDYWFHEIAEFDQNVTILKNLKNDKKKIITEKSGIMSESYRNVDDNEFSLIAIIFLAGILMIGILIGKYLFNRDKNVYIQLDGNNYSDRMWETGVKAF